jgi:hypothetical protein
MENLMLIIFATFKMFAPILIGVVILGVIQMLVYQTTGFSIYNKLVEIFNKKAGIK